MHEFPDAATDVASDQPRRLSRAWYGAPISLFRTASEDSILGTLAAASGFSITVEQRDAWLTEISHLKTSIPEIEGSVFLEFEIPRMGHRVDAVVISGSAVFVIEFKVGASAFDRAAVDQVWDYALDLKNFHEASHHAIVVPVLVATESTRPPRLDWRQSDDGVFHPVCARTGDLRAVLEDGVKRATGQPIVPDEWSRSPYRPTPTIIEAARALYSQHSVESITRSDSGAKNLAITSRHIGKIIDHAQTHRRKAICFVTGVPGAGKTLVGLNVATQRREKSSTHAVFLSGNGPLVAVLREALTRDEYFRKKAANKSVRKGEIGTRVKAFIQNVHHFRDDGLKDEGAPADHVVIFDEAQRAWNAAKTESFMKARKGRVGFTQSEPSFLVSCLDRHRDWAVIVCLVGGGQEIHTGEAGIGAWIDAISTTYPDWDVHISSRLTDAEFEAGRAIMSLEGRSNVHTEDSLHLDVAIRSFRSEHVSRFVKSVLDGEVEQARQTLTKLDGRYPVVVTRNLRTAKEWIRSRARGTERFGLVASSKAQRLKPHAIDVRVNIDPIHWFLSDREDTRSSFFMEDAATEFQVQGLELDWVCVTWDGDLRRAGSRWSFHDFRGSRWQNINKEENQVYLKNAYRVLLTRARQGMVIFIPEGDPNDGTRIPEFYDSTFNYLKSIGLQVI